MELHSPFHFGFPCWVVLLGALAVTSGCASPMVESSPPPAQHENRTPPPPAPAAVIADSYSLTVRCTYFYAGERHSDPDTDAGRSSTGVTLRPATDSQVGVCAVDPLIIPYGSGVIVQSVDGPRYYVAADTGGAVKHQTASDGKLPVIDFYSDHQVGREIDQVTILPYRGSVGFKQLTNREKQPYFDLKRFQSRGD